MRSVLAGTILIFSGMMLLAGCGQKSVREHREATALMATDPETAAEMFHVDLDFCRRVGKKTGKMFNIGNEFEMKESSAVWAVTTFNNVEPGKLYAVHMVWCKPHRLTDQKEMYRKYAEVRVEEDPEGGYIAHIDWKNAIELSYLKQTTQKSDTPSFYLKSKFNTSLKKGRSPGDYSMIVHLHREQITEGWFHLDGPLPAEAEEIEEMDGAT